MPDELNPLPIQCSLYDEESGHGFLYRSAKANGINLDSLIKIAGAPSQTWLRTEDIETLAFLTSTAPDALSRQTRQRCLSGGRRVFSYLGCTWMGVEALRVRSLQVCADCLREREHCSAIWELTGYCACVRHRRVLMDRCGHCRRLLDWSRPAIDLCLCKNYLKRPTEEDVASPNLVAWCRWLESRTTADETADPSGLLPTWLTQIEPDGAFQLVMALGCRKFAGERISAADSVREIRPAEMAACLTRALERASEVLEGDALSRDVAALIDTARLERLARFGVGDSSRRAAYYLLRRMQYPVRLNQIGRPMRNGRSALGQLHLFGDDARAR